MLRLPVSAVQVRPPRAVQVLHCLVIRVNLPQRREHWAFAFKNLRGFTT